MHKRRYELNIVMIGSGNVAAVLGRKFRAAGHSIVQVYGRNAGTAGRLAAEWGTVAVQDHSQLSPDADLYMIAVADDAIGEVTREMKLPGKVVAHTAAAVPAAVLAGVTGHYGVFYPLQSLRSEMKQLPDIPVFTDGNDDMARDLLEQLARSISGGKVYHAGDEERLKLHVAAVVVSNFTNHLFVLAEEYCRKENIDFRQLWPLIQETASRVRDISPRQVQTGPAIRNDKATIRRHLEILEKHPQLRNIYLTLSESIRAGNGPAGN